MLVFVCVHVWYIYVHVCTCVCSYIFLCRICMVNSTVEPRLSESPLSKHSVIRTLGYLNAISNFKIPKDKLILCK